MGGEREQFLSSGNRTPAQIGKVRIHEDKGQVHLHDDDNKVKVAIDCDKFWKAWEQISATQFSGNEITTAIPLHDTVNQSIAIIERVIKLSSPQSTVTTSIRLEKATFDDNFQKIDSFVKGR